MPSSVLRDASVKRPTRVIDPESERLRREVVRLNSLIVGITFGILFGWGLFLATLWLVLKGGPQVGPHLILLANYFPGYRVTVLGSFIGFVYGFVTGFLAGSLIGWIYNYIIWFRQR